MAKIFVSGTLGDPGMAGTFEDFTGDAVNIAHLDDVVVTMKGGATADATAAMTLQYSQDGVRWAATPASSACTYAAPSASFAPTGRVKLVRALVSAMDTDAFAVRYSGRVNDQLQTRFGTMGDFEADDTGDAIDVSDLEKVIVTNTGGASSTVALQASYNGTDWVDINSFTSAGSFLVPFPCKAIRGDCTTYSAAAYLRYGGHRAAGKQRFGTLGNFTTTATGTAVDVSDLNSVGIVAEYTGVGTFAASLTILIEGSSDGTSWATVPSGSITSAGSLAVTGPYRLLRARCSAHVLGSAKVRFGGVNNDLVG